jgi:hypothetical protein
MKTENPTDTSIPCFVRPIAPESTSTVGVVVVVVGVLVGVILFGVAAGFVLALGLNTGTGAGAGAGGAFGTKMSIGRSTESTRYTDS